MKVSEWAMVVYQQFKALDSGGSREVIEGPNLRSEAFGYGTQYVLSKVGVTVPHIA